MSGQPAARIKLFVRLAIAAGLTAYILWKSDPLAVATASRNASLGPIAVAVLLVLFDRALMAYRWVLLLCIVGRRDRPPLSEVMRIFFVSTFVGTFLPASVGGDAVRAYSLSKLRVGGSDAVASVFMDRMLGVASIVIMAIAGLQLSRDLMDNRTIVVALGLAAVACVMTLLVIFSRGAASSISALLVRFPSRVQQMGRSFLESIQRYAAFHRQLFNVLAASVVVQILRVVQAYYLGQGLGIQAPVTMYFAFIPLILLIMLLPVTFNGIGTSQAAFVWFFGRAGVAAGSAFALSVLFVALGIVGNLPGGILYVRGKAAQTERAG